RCSRSAAPRITRPWTSFAAAPPAPKNPTPLEAMAHRLATPEGKKLYGRRKHPPEPVFGIIKSVLPDDANLRSTGFGRLAGVAPRRGPSPGASYRPSSPRASPPHLSCPGHNRRLDADLDASAGRQFLCQFGIVDGLPELLRALKSAHAAGLREESSTPV